MQTTHTDIAHLEIALIRSHLCSIFLLWDKKTVSHLTLTIALRCRPGGENSMIRAGMLEKFRKGKGRQDQCKKHLVRTPRSHENSQLSIGPVALFKGEGTALGEKEKGLGK